MTVLIVTPNSSRAEDWRDLLGGLGWESRRAEDFAGLERLARGVPGPFALIDGVLEVRRRYPSGVWKAVSGLTPKEFDLLCLFVSSPEEDMERRLLIEKVWRRSAGKVNPEALDKQVASLRKKLGPQGRRIRTLRGVGYRFLKKI